jgi:hypothetical protein
MLHRIFQDSLLLVAWKPAFAVRQALMNHRDFGARADLDFILIKLIVFYPKSNKFNNKNPF